MNLYTLTLEPIISINNKEFLNKNPIIHSVIIINPKIFLFTLIQTLSIIHRKQTGILSPI